MEGNHIPSNFSINFTWSILEYFVPYLTFCHFEGVHGFEWKDAVDATRRLVGSDV